jgi:hypothetical protein
MARLGLVVEAGCVGSAFRPCFFLSVPVWLLDLEKLFKPVLPRSAEYTSPVNQRLTTACLEVGKVSYHSATGFGDPATVFPFCLFRLVYAAVAAIWGRRPSGLLGFTVPQPPAQGRFVAYEGEQPTN